MWLVSLFNKFKSVQLMDVLIDENVELSVLS